MSLPFIRPMDIDPSGPSCRTRQVSFLSSSVAPFTPFGPSLSEKGGQMGWQPNNYRLTVRCSWVDGLNTGVNGDRLNRMTIEMSSGRWQGKWDDGLERQRSPGIQSSDKLPRSIYDAWHVSSFGWFLSWIEAPLCLPCTSPIQTCSLSLISLLYAENTLSKRVRHPC